MTSFRLFVPFLSFGIKRELEFRFNLMFFLLFDVVWMALSLFSVYLVFNQTGTIAGWNRDEATLLVLVYYLAGSVIKSFIIPAAEELSELVRLGRFDLYLTKPVDVRMLLMFSNMYLHELTRLFLMVIVIPWYLGHSHIVVFPGQWILFLIVSIAGCIGFFGMYFAVAALSFWLQNVFNFGDLFRETLDVAKRPIDIFQGYLRNLATFVIPIGLVASIPTKILLGKADWTIALWSVLVIGLIYLVSSSFFHLAIRHYSSASS